MRFRATQMIGLIMNGLAEEDELSEELFEAVQDAMLSRTHDKIPLVRVHAAHALHRLQAPSDKDDPVSLELLRLMGADTSADVRLVALKSIGLSRHTLPHVLRRARDVRPDVRAAVYGAIGAKLDTKWLSIAQRVGLLRDGLRDRDEPVRAACAEMLVAHWLRKADGSAAAVLGALHAEENADVAELAAKELLSGAELPAQLAGEAPWRPGAPRLSLEEALLLRVRYEALAAGPAAGRAQLEACLPDVPSFLAVLAAHAQQPAVLRELLGLARVLDLSDEAGRRMLGAHAGELLASARLVSAPGGGALAAAALELLRRTHDSELSLVREVAELISELHDPLDGAADDDPTLPLPTRSRAAASCARSSRRASRCRTRTRRRWSSATSASSRRSSARSRPRARPRGRRQRPTSAAWPRSAWRPRSSPRRAATRRRPRWPGSAAR